METLQGTFYKPFFDLRGTTMVAKHIARALAQGVARVWLIVDYPDPFLSVLTERYQKDFDGIEIRLIVQAGSASDKIRFAVDELVAADDHVFVSLGDTFCQFTTSAFVAVLESTGADSAIAVGSLRLPFGVVSAQDGLVSSFIEKPITSVRVNLGQMWLGRRAIESISSGADIASVLSALARVGDLAEVDVPGQFLTLDSLDDIARALDPARSL